MKKYSQPDRPVVLLHETNTTGQTFCMDAVGAAAAAAAATAAAAGAVRAAAALVTTISGQSVIERYLRMPSPAP